MAVLPVITDCFRVVLNWEHPTLGNAVNVMHFLGDPGTVGGLWTALDGTVHQDMWDATSDLAAVTKVTITKLDGTSASVDHVTGSPTRWKGANTGAGVPMAAAIAKFTTARRGRSYRGRVFIPWIIESAMDVGIITPAVVTAMQTRWETFQTGMEAGTYTLAVASYLHATAEPVTGLSVEPRIATQRRRNSRLR